MSMRLLLNLLIASLFVVSLTNYKTQAQPLKLPGEIKWMSLQEAAMAFNREPKKIFVDIGPVHLPFLCDLSIFRFV